MPKVAFSCWFSFDFSEAESRKKNPCNPIDSAVSRMRIIAIGSIQGFSFGEGASCPSPGF
jgi:hypothetical protein